MLISFFCAEIWDAEPEIIFEDGGTHTFSVSRVVGETVVKLDEKFLPDSVATKEYVDQNASGGAKQFYGTIGTNWTEDSNTGAKYQLVAIEGVTADMELGRLDTVNTHDRTSEGYAAYVEEQNQFLTYITNGDAETVDGGVMFYIYGEPNTVDIPFGLVV